MGKTKSKSSSKETFLYCNLLILMGLIGLYYYLTKPKDFIPGNKMAFPGLKKAEQIENIIAFLEETTK